MNTATATTTADKLAELAAREAQLRMRLQTKLPAAYRKFAKMALANIAAVRAQLQQEGGR